MRNTTRLHLLLSVATAAAALPLIAVSTRAATNDIYETNMGMVLRILPTGGTPITFAQGLSNPKGLVFDGIGHLFVADATAGTILRFTPPDGTAATYVTGLSSPVGLAFDISGGFYVGEAGSGNIIKFAQDGTRTTFASGLGSPAGLAFANNGNLFVTDFNGGKIYQVTSDWNGDYVCDRTWLPGGSGL